MYIIKKKKNAYNIICLQKIYITVNKIILTIKQKNVQPLI